MSQLSFIEPEIRKHATLSECGALRWRLRRWWRNDTQVCWIMLNPSIADAERDDPTIRRCIHFSQLWGYGGLVVVNLYPYRSSTPADCKRWADWERRGPDWYVRDQLMRNQEEIILACESSHLIVAAWGAHPWAMEWADHINTLIDEAIDEPIYCLGTTADGSPKHPMARGLHRVPDHQAPAIWRAS